jgi:hypothetical protein
MTAEELDAIERDTQKTVKVRAEHDAISRECGFGRVPPSKTAALILALVAEVRAASAQALKAIGERDEARRTCDSSALVINDCTARLAAAESALASAREQALEEAALRIETVCTDGLLWVVKAIRSLKATAPTGGSK